MKYPSVPRLLAGGVLHVFNNRPTGRKAQCCFGALTLELTLALRRAVGHVNVEKRRFGGVMRSAVLIGPFIVASLRSGER